jgi:nickel-type superoxide dismutase maturation protease
MKLAFRLFKVPDGSMEPGLKSGQYVMVSGLSKRVKEGDIVVLKHPYRNMHLVKRVKNANNGRYFVLGDNETLFGEDSREFGHVSEGQIIGKVIFKR